PCDSSSDPDLLRGCEARQEIPRGGSSRCSRPRRRSPSRQGCPTVRDSRSDQPDRRTARPSCSRHQDLRSSEEIRLARERAAAQTGYDPLRQYSLAGVDLKEFIDSCVFDSMSVKNDRELLERFGKK